MLRYITIAIVQKHFVYCMQRLLNCIMYKMIVDFVNTSLGSEVPKKAKTLGLDYVFSELLFQSGRNVGRLVAHNSHGLGP